MGNYAGPVKVQKVKDVGKTIVNEDGLFNLIKTLPGNMSPNSPKKKTNSSPTKLSSVEEIPPSITPAPPINITSSSIPTTIPIQIPCK